jgi:hypothetical protein
MAQGRPSESLLAAPGIQHRVPRRTLSPHPALPLSVPRPLGRISSAFRRPSRGLRPLSGTSAREIPTGCGPSPCDRLSRPRTTTAAPTPPRSLFPTAGNIRCRGASHVHADGLLRSRLGGGYQGTQAALCGIPAAGGVVQVGPPGPVGRQLQSLPVGVTCREGTTTVSSRCPPYAGRLHRVVVRARG